MTADSDFFISACKKYGFRVTSHDDRHFIETEYGNLSVKDGTLAEMTKELKRAITDLTDQRKGRRMPLSFSVQLHDLVTDLTAQCPEKEAAVPETKRFRLFR